MARNVVRIDDLVEGEQGGLVIVGEVGAHQLRGQNVIVSVEHGQVLHLAEVNLDDNSTIWARKRRLPSRRCKNGEGRNPGGRAIEGGERERRRNG